MQKFFTFRSAYEYFIELYKSGEIKGSSYVLRGREGSGKTHTIDLMAEVYKADKKKVLRARSFSSNEALMYQVYNDLLNQFFGAFKERSLSEIVEAFTEMDPKKVENTFIVIDGLENMLQNSRELFIYIARLAPKKGFTLIGTITEDYVEDEKTILRFLKLVDNEPDILFFNYDKATLDDINYMLKIDNYTLPTSFVQELYRLTNGNVRSLWYTLRYYMDQGIINDKKALMEVTYRYFPIPPSSEKRFELIIKDLNPTERTVLEVMSLIQEDLSPSFVSELTQIERREVIDALEKLKNLGLVTQISLNYSVLNSTLSEIVLKDVYSSSGYILSENFIKQRVFNKLPFITRLKAYELRKDATSIEALVNAEWRPFIDRISFIAFSKDLFTNLRNIVTSKEGKAHLALMEAQSKLNVGEHEGAMEIYSSPEVVEVEPFFARLSEAKLLQKLDRLQESIESCKSILEMKNLSPYDRISTLNVLAVNYSFSNQVDLGLETTSKAIELASKHSFEDLLADSKGTMGTLMVKKFDLQKALEYYNETLQISQKYKIFDRELLTLNNVAIIHSYWGQFDKAITMLAQIIEKSYISGELLSRAYATYNLCEIYYNIAQTEEFHAYFPSARGLVRLLSEGNLSYPFFRFASLVSIDMMNSESAVKYTEELMKISKSLGSKPKEDLSRGMYLLAQSKLSQSLLDELELLFSSDLGEVDDFLPTWHLFAVIHFSLMGEDAKAKASLERLNKASDIMGDSIGYLVKKLGRVFIYLLEDNKDELRKLTDEGFTIGDFKKAHPKLRAMLQDYLDQNDNLQSHASTINSYFNLAAAILMDLKPHDIERDGLDNYNYFQKCRAEIGKGADRI